MKKHIKTQLPKPFANEARAIWLAWRGEPVLVPAVLWNKSIPPTNNHYIKIALVSAMQERLGK